MPWPTAMVVTLCSQVSAALPRKIATSPIAAASSRSSGASCDSSGMLVFLSPSTSSMTICIGHGFNSSKPATRKIWANAQTIRHL